MKHLNIIILVTFLFATPLAAERLVVEEPCGKQHVIEFHPATPFLDVLNSIKQYLPPKEALNQNPSLVVRPLKAPSLNAPRDFYTQITEQERRDIRYLLDYLAHSSLFSISTSKKSLQKIAKQLDHLHPLHVLSVIYTDPELLSFLHKIRNRTLVWSELFDEYSDSLNEESNFGNIVSHAEEFANSIHIHPFHISSAMHERNWKEFFEILFEAHPMP